MFHLKVDSTYQSKTYHPRSGVTFVEIVISMVLIGIIFATFLVSIGNLLIHNTKTNTILEFMYHTSQGNVDPVINGVGVYLDKKANLISAQKDIEDLSGLPPTEQRDAQIAARQQEVSAYLDFLNNDPKYSHNVLFPVDATTQKRHIKEHEISKLNRGVTLAYLGSRKDEYLKASWTDKGGNQLDADTDNAIYRFGKTSGAEKLYSLVSLEVMTTSLPKQKITKISRDFVYPHELNSLKRSSSWSENDSYDENGFIYYTYWYEGDSDQSGAGALTFMDTRDYYYQPSMMISQLNMEAPLRVDVPKDIGYYKRVDNSKDKEKLQVSGDLFTKYGGSWFRMGVQPVYGYAGAAYPSQPSTNACYVIPLPYASVMKPKSHYNPSFMGLVTKENDKARYSNLVSLDEGTMGTPIGVAQHIPSFKNIYDNTDYNTKNNKPTAFLENNNFAGTFIPVLKKQRRTPDAPIPDSDYDQPVYSLLVRSDDEKNLDDMLDKRTRHNTDFLPLTAAVDRIESSASVFRRRVKTANCGAAFLNHAQSLDNWKQSMGKYYAPKLLSMTNLKVNIPGIKAVGLTFYAFDCNQNLGASTDGLWTLSNDFKISGGNPSSLNAIQDFNRHTLIKWSDNSELGYAFFRNEDNVIYTTPNEAERIRKAKSTSPSTVSVPALVCIPYLKKGTSYYLPQYPNELPIDQNEAKERKIAFYHTICPYGELNSVMVYGGKIWINGYLMNFGERTEPSGRPISIGGGKGNINLAEILTYKDGNLDDNKLRLVHAYMTLGRTTGSTLSAIQAGLTQSNPNPYPDNYEDANKE